MTIKQDHYGNVVQAARPYTSQVVVVGAGSVTSVAFSVNPNNRTYGDTYPTSAAPNTVNVVNIPNHTMHVRLVSTVACWVSFGSPPPTAVKGNASSMYLPPGLPEYFWVRPGSQIAVNQDSAAGSLYITELAND